MDSQAYLSKNGTINHNPTLEKSGIIRGKLVDDEIYINLLFRIVLEDRGFKVDTFEDPIAALEKYRPHLYELLILDIKMPKNAWL